MAAEFIEAAAHFDRAAALCDAPYSDEYAAVRLRSFNAREDLHLGAIE